MGPDFKGARTSTDSEKAVDEQIAISKKKVKLFFPIAGKLLGRCKCHQGYSRTEVAGRTLQLLHISIAQLIHCRLREEREELAKLHVHAVYTLSPIPAIPDVLACLISQ